MGKGTEIFSGKKYLSARQASLETGYSQDYVGQLCRSGKIDARRVGRAWYVSEQAIKNYEKNTRVGSPSLLASSSSSIKKSNTRSSSRFGYRTLRVFAVGVAVMLFLSILFTSLPTLMEKAGTKDAIKADAGSITTGRLETVVQDLVTDDLKVWSDDSGRAGVIRQEKTQAP